MQTDQTEANGVTITDHRGAPTAPKPDEKAPEKRTPEAEKLWEEGRSKMNARMFPNAKKIEDEEQKPKKEKEKPERKAPETKGDDDEKAKEKDKEKEKGKLRPVEKKEAPPVDYEKLATSVATATAKALRDKPSDKAEDKAGDEPKEEEVPEMRRRDLAAIEHLDRENPKYKGVLPKYKKFAKEEDAYVKKWQEENPGHKYDPESVEHEAFYEKHEPEIDADDIQDAKIEVIAERRAMQLAEKDPTKKELEKLKLERDIERAEQTLLPQVTAQSIGMVAEAMGEHVVEMVGKLKPGETLAEEDPAAHEALSQVIPELRAQTTAAVHIFATTGQAFDPKNQAHAEVARAASELQTGLLKLPDEERRLEDGRTFVTLDAWAGMNAEQRKAHWTIDAQLMGAHLAAKAAEKASKIYKTEQERLERAAKAYGWTKNGEARREQRRAPVEEEEPEDNGKPRSPSTTNGAIIKPGTTVKPNIAIDGPSKHLNRMFGR